MNLRFILSVIAVIIVVMVISAAFASSHEPEAAGRVGVAASFYPLADFARQVGGDRVQVTNLTPVGTEPHDYDPSPQDIVKIEQAKVFIYTGAGFEPWAEKVVPELGDIAVVNASQGVELMPAGDEEAGRGSGGFTADPHFYLDPVGVQQIVRQIADALAAVDPANAAYYQENASRYDVRLAELDAAYRSGLASCVRRDIITSHAAFAYLAQRYGLTQVAIAGLADEDPSPARLAEIADLVRARNIKYIFFESLVSPRLSETIAAETGARTLVLNPVEGLTAEERAAGKDFIGLMRDNLANLRLALECS